MNYAHADLLTATGTLDGQNFIVNERPRRWCCIYAHVDSVVNVTSSSMTLNNGTTPLSGFSATIGAKSYWFGLFDTIQWVSGAVTCYRQEGI